MVAVSDLFHPKFKLFKLMCKDYELCPIDLTDDHIFYFLKKLGLNVEMDLTLFIRFAKEIESSRSCNFVVEKQSSRLVKELFKMDVKFFKTEDLTSLSTIRFVLPLKVSSEIESIHSYFNRGRFIKFQGSMLPSSSSGESIKLCWTVSDVLSEKADPKMQVPSKTDLIVSALRIKREPQVKDLVKHFKNVSESVHEKIRTGQPINYNTLELVMKLIYEKLDKLRENRNLTTAMLEPLIDKPIIYLPVLQQFVLPSAIIIECSDDETIPPFLNKCPNEYVGQRELFISFGARKITSLDTYASVLRKLKSRCDNAGQLLFKERKDGAKAMRQFFNYLSQSSCSLSSEEELYLVSKDFKLVKASTIVVIDSENFFSKIPEQYKESMMFLMEYTDLLNYNFKKGIFLESLINLPQACRPHLLTDLMKVRIDLEHIQMKEVLPAKKLEEFIHGRVFLNAVISLVRNAFKENKARWNDDKERKIAIHLENITCKHVTGIQTVLELKIIRNELTEPPITIENTNKTKYVHIEVTEENVCIYFDAVCDKWIEDVQTELSVHLNGSFEHRLKDEHLMALRKIIGMIGESDRIFEILGDAGVPEYYSSIEIKNPHTYPIPGEFVPREMHCYLDNDYGLFYNYDYKFVALELNDPAFDVDDNEFKTHESINAPGDDLDSTYIFVHILEKQTTGNIQPLLQEYKIDDGSGTPRIVKAFQLFKFIALSERTRTENRLIIYERTLTGERVADRNTTISLKQALSEVRIYLIEAWQQSVDVRRRIVKRLMLKWHPDKNPDNVAICTEVFQYIQLCLERLERGLELPGNNDADTNDDLRTPSSTWDWENSWYKQYWERRQQYRSTEEHQRDDEYPQAQPKSEQEPYHWYAEGRRWQRQAVSDLENARASMQENTGNTFNWVCYKTHQAAEKSLKAAWYAKDANQICSVQYSHDIVSIASGLGSELSTLSRQLSDLTGDHTRMRYPDALRGQQIPAEAYTRQTAETVIQLAEQIIQKVQSDYLN